MTKQIDCYVEVAGTPSHEDDQDLPGYYLVNLRLSRAIDQSDVSEDDKSQMAEAVLNEFHEKQGIEVLDDFSICVRLPTGQVIHEIEHSAKKLVKSASFHGEVSKSDLPFSVSRKTNRSCP